MRLRIMVLVLGLAVLFSPMVGAGQDPERLNPMIVLHEQGLPIFGVTHPAINARRARGARRGGGARGGRGTARGRGAGRGTTGNGGATAAEPLPQPVLADVARETVGYKFSDFEYNSYSPASSERFMGYMAAMLAAGGTMKDHAFISKIPIVHNDSDRATARIVDQLNAGHAGIMMQEVESADEVRQAIAAMRFRSRGGTRPEEGIGLAAAYWGLTGKEYLDRADVWPINPKGELVLWAIVESREGIANVREIAAVPGLTSLIVGAGTLGGVFSSTNADGERVRDQEGFDAAVEKVIAACKEFKVACSYPANNPDQIESLMDRGFEVFTMQRRGPEAFDAVQVGRRRSGRPLTQ
jgi:4-hydroxy-2-oxoheptanedioate aldolase